ncbi:MAG: gstB 1 [Gammaproteobacteria bacterium]|nr:gstB 1 [Gammaproteobacteria bacterium]
MTPYKLYGRQNSGSLCVQVALEEIGTPYECVWIPADEADVAKFRKINPTGKVPALVLPDGIPMFESAAILTHLALAHPDAGLAPAPGTSEHAVFLQWMTFLSANVYQAALRMYYAARYSGAEGDAERISERGTKDFLEHLGLIGQSLGPYVLGTRYSIADAYLYMLATWYPAGKAELYARLPSLGAHAQKMSHRRAVSKAEADHAV